MREQTAYRPLAPRAHATREHTPAPRRDIPPRDTDEYERSRMPVVVKRYNQPVQAPMRMVIHDQRKPQPPQQKRLRQQRHPLTYIGFGMVILAVLAFAVYLLAGWWNGYQQDQRYGMPRTYQVDMKVGHGDSQVPSHFVAINLKKRVVITEFPGSDTTKATIYTGPVLGEEKTPVTLEFRDVNGDSKLDMLIGVEKMVFPFINEGKKFRPAKAEEPISL